MNWDDLRIVAAVRDEGTYAGASARLRIDETTVGRRLARIERGLGLRLFEAVDGLRKPTRQCETVLAHVQAMAGHVAAINKVGESLPGLTGRFRLASTNAISKLAEVRLYLIEPAIEADVDPVVCGYSEELGAIPESQYLKARGLQQRARCITDNVRVIRRLIQSHQAIGILPEYSCQELLADRRLRATLLPRRRDVWLLVQNHLKRDPAARAVIDWVRDCFQELSKT